MMTQRIYNFSAGPAVLPVPVLAEAQRDLLALPNAGASILEISHRSSTFAKIIENCESDFRSLLAIPENYRVLFLQGGARLQFSMIPMNLLGAGSQTADYILTGSWSKNAIKQAELEGSMRIAWDGKETNYDRLPRSENLDLNPGAAYAYFTSNETIQGIQFTNEPEVGDVPLVCDASSDILCRPVPVDRYGLLFACAQKNLGPAGVTVVVIREDLLERCPADLSPMLNYRTHAEQHSLFNTAPTFPIYIMGLVVRWILDEFGSLDSLYRHNQRKAQLLYEAIDASDGFYMGHAQPDFRSVMNVTFRLPSDALSSQF
ncbi:MAG: 3-phosphoserine/phosphohydroxythreonine transaminase, partial [Pirellulales bacterium]|nr:3-phosphoserine/phosphohydroxythreonine transaminase [Pirellulales bacterium]